MGADLNTTNIWEGTNGIGGSWGVYVNEALTPKYRPVLPSYHGSRVLPLGQFVEDPQQINAGKKIPPAELIVVSCFLKTKENEN